MAEPSRLQNTSRDLLFRLVSEGRLAQLQSLINNKRFSQEEREELINSVDEKGASILHFAAYYGHQDIIRWLLSDSGGRALGFNSVLAKDVDGKTALHEAAEFGGELPSVQAIVEGCNQEEQEELINASNSRGYTVFSLAANKAKHSMIEWLLSTAARLTSANQLLGALFLAATNGQLSCVIALLEGCRVEEREKLINAVDDRGATVLYLAAVYGHEDIIRWMLSDAGGRAAGFSSVLAKDQACYTTLQWAAKRGHLSCVQALVEGCKIENGEREMLLNDIDVRKSTVLHTAAEFGHEDIIRWLLSDSGGRAAGFKSVLAQMGFDQTALEVAAEHGHLPCLIALVEGSKLENGERKELLTFSSRALRIAVYSGHEEIIRWFFSDSGGRATGFFSSMDAMDAFHVAASSGRLSCMLAILEGCKAEERAELINAVFHIKATVLHKAADFGHEAIIRWLLSDSGGRAAGFTSVVAKDVGGQTALHQAKDLPCVSALVEGCKAEERGELMNAVSNSGDTVVHWAAGMRRTSIVEWLLSDSGGRAAGFNNVPAKDKNGNSALHSTARIGNLECLQAVVEGCKVENGEREEMVNAVNEEGRTMLHIAASQRDDSLIRWLLSDSGGRAAGFNNVLARDKNGDTASLRLFLSAENRLILLQALLEGCKVENGEREEMLNAVDSKGYTVLHWATGDASILEWLLSDSGGRAAGLKSSTITATTVRGESVLHRVIPKQSVDPLRALLSGCTVGERLTLFLSIDENGWTVVHWAARFRRIDIICELLLHHPETKTIVDHRDHRGMTALHRAVLNGGVDEESRRKWNFYFRPFEDEEEHMQIIEALLTFTPIDDGAEKDPQAARMDVNLGLKIE